MPAWLRRSYYRARAVISGIFGEPHNRIFDLVRVGDLAKNEAFFFAGGLHVDVAEVENCRDNPLDSRGNILDAGKVELAYLTDEQPLLLGIDNTLIGDEPDVEIIIDPCEETEQPHEDEESAFDKNEKAGTFSSGDFWKKEWQKKKAGDKQERREEDDQEVDEDVEPMAMDDVENLFIFMLFLKMAIVEFLGHTRWYNFK